MTPLVRLGMVNENTSGHATFHRHLVAALERTGRFELRAFDTPQPGLLRRLLTRPLPLPPGWDFDLPLFRNQIGQSAVTRRPLRDLAAWADVVHLYTQNVSPLNTDLVRDRPLVVTSDGTCVQTSARFSYRYPGRGAALGRRLSTHVERRLLTRASMVVAQSDWARRSFISDVGLSPDRVQVVRMGAPEPAADATPQRDDDVIRVLFVGASMTRKGGYALLDALRDDLGPRLELHLVTRARVRPTPHVVVHGDVRPGDGKIDALMRRAHVFVLPTDMDMSPNAVLEAMRYGLPVVAYHSGGIPEMVDDGSSGRLAPEGDMAAVRRAVLDLAADRRRAEDFGARGRQILAERFDPATTTAEFVAVVEAVAR